MDDQKLQQEKHDISYWVENELYTLMNLLDESGNKDEGKRNEIIEGFIERCKKVNTTMTEEQLREHILMVLNRTIEKRRKLKGQSDGR